MCGRVDQKESVTTVLGMLANIYDNRAEDASLLVNLYTRQCRENGAEDGCVLSSLLSASVYLTLHLLGDEGKDKVDRMSLWWAGQCQI